MAAKKQKLPDDEVERNEEDVAPKKRSKNRNKTGEEVTYLVEMARGPDVVIQVPANWKLTFSNVNPQHGGMRGEGVCLRIYEGTKLRSVLGNVNGFRDLSIPFARKVESQTGSATWKHDSAGNFERSEKVDVNHRLEKADEDIPF